MAGEIDLIHTPQPAAPGRHYPQAVVPVPALHLGYLIEIEALAGVPEGTCSPSPHGPIEHTS
ncbi:hypothetical protein VM99_01565 [Pseudomonas chlororaphis]|uniref:Uncharacterized protein n=1 Tax=Pseudomonas chlororaphis TaxID=587753 RepID=A0A0G3G8P8_9PSED|nr:hypothetical protein VM99_01565 [Pseudomonas chlororaphis]